MGKGSTRRVEDTEAIRRNWDAVFGPKPVSPEAPLVYPKIERPDYTAWDAHIRVSPTPQTEREISPPLAVYICGIDACEERQ